MSEIDKRGRLDDGIFEYQITKDGRILIYWENRLIKTIAGKPAAKFIAVVDALTDKEVQLALAKLTGNFKHGNERR